MFLAGMVIILFQVGIVIILIYGATCLSTICLNSLFLTNYNVAILQDSPYLCLWAFSFLFEMEK